MKKVRLGMTRIKLFFLPTSQLGRRRCEDAKKEEEIKGIKNDEDGSDKRKKDVNRLWMLDGQQQKSEAD